MFENNNTRNEKDLLDHAGKVSAKVAEELALERYEEFDKRRRQEEKRIADAEDTGLLEVLEEKVICSTMLFSKCS